MECDTYVGFKTFRVFKKSYNYHLLKQHKKTEFIFVRLLQKAVFLVHDGKTVPSFIAVIYMSYAVKCFSHCCILAKFNVCVDLQSETRYLL